MTEQVFFGLAAVPISRLAEHVDQEVLVQGWLYNLRSKGKIHFLQVRDGTGIVQAVLGINDVPAPDFEMAGRLTQESSLRLKGKVRADARAPGGFELTVTGIALVHLAEPNYPIQPKEHGAGFLM